MSSATASAHPNIALVKYWGKRDRKLNLPSTGSISLTVDRFQTTTEVRFGVEADSVEIDGKVATEGDSLKVTRMLDLVVPGRGPARVISASNFPAAAGLASSASAFAALAVAAAAAAGQELEPRRLSALARQGSGSACRSLYGGFVEWSKGENADGSDSHALALAPPEHWDLKLVVAIVDAGKKKMASTAGMVQTQATSPMYPAWVADADRDVAQAREAIAAKDLEKLGVAMERSTLKMFATMLTTEPAIRYWKPASVALMEIVEDLRARGIPAWWTMDAGPNVKVLTEAAHAEAVAAALREATARVEVLGIGGPPRILA